MKQTIGMLAVAILISTAAAASSPLMVNNSISSFYKNIENPGKDELIITPSFKTGAAKITFTSANAGKGTIEVSDEKGVTVLKQAVTVTTGKNILTIEKFTSLSEGSYNVSVSTECNKITAPFLLWK